MDLSRALVTLLRHGKYSDFSGGEQEHMLPSSGYLATEFISSLFGLPESYVVIVARASYDEEKSAYKFDLMPDHEQQAHMPCRG